jgi:hypothetical protein
MKRSSQEEVDKLNQDYERAIGRIVIAWNEYQEQLGMIFGKLFGRRQWALSLSAWHALESDRAQRSMLAAVARVKLKSKDPLLAEIIWLVERTNQMISDQRNNGIHTPLMRYMDIDGAYQILPLAMFGNTRATKLAGYDLLTEFTHYEKQIRKMFGYAVAVDFALTPKKKRTGPSALPERPQLQNRAPQPPPQAMISLKDRLINSA